MASSSEKSNLDELDGNPEMRTRHQRHLECVNRNCQRGDNLSAALYFVCSYYNVTWKQSKKVCQGCLVQCLSHYKRLEHKFKKKQCILNDHFPNYDSHMIIESSSSEDEEPMPSTSKHGLPINKELETALNITIDYVLKKNNDLIDTQITLCNDYLDKEFDECMHEADSIDSMASKLENEIKLLKSELYDPYKPIITILSSDSEPDLGDEVIDVDKIQDVQIHKFNENDSKKENNISEKNIEGKLKSNKDKKMNKNKIRETDKFKLNKEVEIDQEIIAINRTVCATPYDLPNEGPLIIPPLQKGQKVLATHMSLSLPWYTCTVSAVLNEKYVLIESNVGDKLVAINLVAYSNLCPVRFKVGTKVVAKLKDQSRNIDSFYAGIIAEPPKLLNKFRYLIFFYDGNAQYIHHKHIRLVVGQTLNGLCFHVNPEFIRSYLDQYPGCERLRLIKGHSVKVEHNNEWLYAKVVKVDASLVKLYIPEKNCFEWLYRGSPRLWKIYEKQSKPERGICSRQTGLASLKKPSIDYSSIDEVPSRPARSVARKSTSKKSITSQHEKVKKSIPINDESELKLLSLPKDCLVPKKFVHHTCSSLCVKWTKYNYMKTKQINTLAVPLHFGFRRCLYFFNTSQKCITYRTPCGLSIRSLKEMHDYLMKTKSMMTIDQFDFNSWVNPFTEFRILKSIIYSQDMSEGKEFRGISVVNTINYNTPPKMKYMTVRQAMPGVNINVENEFLCGCDCTDNCLDKSKCACWQLTIEGQKILPNLDQDPNIGYSYRRLSERVLTGIYECNKTCKCSKSCLNRVVQNPLSQKLQLFLTEKKGWGVRCLNDIPQGSFICIYVGYLLTETDANEGGINYGDEYLAELDYIEVVEKIKEDYETDVPLSENDENLMNSESSSEDLQTTVEDYNFTHRLHKPITSKYTTKNKNDGLHVRIPFKLNTHALKNDPKLPKSIREYFGNNESVYIMDAKTSGNIGRYLNHSCSPNVFVQNVFVDTHDLRFPWVSFFALHYIPAGTELTWDYNYDIGSVPGKIMKCNCESVYCRGRLL